MEMEAEKEQDPFASIIKFCKPIAPQEAKFPNCPLARESESFLDSNNEQLSSSPDLMPSEPTGIVVISLPDSSCSVDQHTVEEDAVFVTPPEQLRVPEARDATKVRASEVGLDDEPEMKRIKVERGEEFDGDVVRLGDTEEAEIKGVEGDIIVLGSGDSGAEEIMATSNLDAVGEAGTVSIVREIGGLLSNSEAKFDAIYENRELRENAEVIGVPKAEKPEENSDPGVSLDSGKISDPSRSLDSGKISDSSRSLDSGKIEGDIAKLKCIAGKSCLKVRLRIRGFDKAVKTPKDAKKTKDSHRNGRVRSSRKRIEEIDEFRYDGECKGRTGTHVGGSGSKRLLPRSLEGKEKEVVESSEKKSGLLDLLGILKTVFGDVDGGGDCEEDVDFLETAKRRGMTFPRPRWWPSDGDEEEGFSS